MFQINTIVTPLNIPSNSYRLYINKISHRSVCRPANRTVSASRAPVGTFRCLSWCTGRSWRIPFARWTSVCGRTSLPARGSATPHPPCTRPRIGTACTRGRSCNRGWPGTPSPVRRGSACTGWSPPVSLLPPRAVGPSVVAAEPAGVPRVPRKLRAARKARRWVTTVRKGRLPTALEPSSSSPGTCSIAPGSRPCFEHKNERL